MRHRIKGRRLGRTTQHRRALARNLITALFTNGRIVTTGPKAKEYRPIAEKLITLGREKSVHRVRRATAVLQDRAAVSRLFDTIGPSFRDRPGGYTRIVRLPKPRLGDKGSRVFLELVNYVPPARESDKDEDAAKAGRGKGEKASAAAGKSAKAGKGRGKRGAGDESGESDQG
jgi:large subunit ribosomal protein L17